MNMNLNQAIALIEKYLAKSEVEMNRFGSALPGYVNPNIKLQIMSDKTEEIEVGWVFYYNSAKFIETGNFQDAIAGNAPLIVNRNSGAIIETGTARETDYYVKNYVHYGDPHHES